MVDHLNPKTTDEGTAELAGLYITEYKDDVPPPAGKSVRLRSSQDVFDALNLKQYTLGSIDDLVRDFEKGDLKTGTWLSASRASELLNPSSRK